MKLKALFIGLALTHAGTALAADAYLRLRCDGDAAGAKVTINGVRKGECPVDLAIPEGQARIVVRKDLTQHSYRVFEKDLFLAGGAMKRETVVLGPVQFTPEGQRLENERIAREQAAAKALAAAHAERERLAAEEKAKYGMTQEFLDTLSTKSEQEMPFSTWSLMLTYSPIYLPLSTLFDLSSGKQLIRQNAADPAAFANPDSMAAKAAAGAK